MEWSGRKGEKGAYGGVVVMANGGADRYPLVEEVEEV